jgi:hypothetical protein
MNSIMKALLLVSISFCGVLLLAGCGASGDKDTAAASATVVSPEKAKEMGLGKGRAPMSAAGTTMRKPASQGG